MTIPSRPKLDVRFHKDPQSRAYATRSLIGRVARFKRVWTTRKAGPLDQDNTGHCVGFSCAGGLASKPQSYEVDNDTGHKIFWAAQSIDQSEGRIYDDGATMLAGLKACQRANYFTKYGWNFGIDDTINWIVRRGPALLAINWYESMFWPVDGLISVGGPLAGGHAILANGFWPKHPTFGDVLVLTNSWGKGWGINGRGYLPVESLDKLLKEDGESAAPTELPVHPI